MQIAGVMGERPRSTLFGSLLILVALPLLAVAAVLVIPFFFGVRWLRGFHENAFHAGIRACGRGISWQEFRRSIGQSGGTCIEERFSPNGPVRFWWTPENIYEQSPYKITSWFAMRKGGRYAPFIHWCRERYTCPDRGNALLIETFGVSRKEIYAIWSECRSEHPTARWVEVPPPELLASCPQPSSIQPSTAENAGLQPQSALPEADH